MIEQHPFWILVVIISFIIMGGVIGFSRLKKRGFKPMFTGGHQNRKKTA